MDCVGAWPEQTNQPTNQTVIVLIINNLIKHRRIEVFIITRQGRCWIWVSSVYFVSKESVLRQILRPVAPRPVSQFQSHRHSRQHRRGWVIVEDFFSVNKANVTSKTEALRSNPSVLGKPTAFCLANYRCAGQNLLTVKKKNSRKFK